MIDALAEAKKFKRYYIYYPYYWLKNRIKVMLYQKDLTKLKKVIADNKERWVQSLTYMADERIEDPEWVIEGHLEIILDDLINKMTGKGD